MYIDNCIYHDEAPIMHSQPLQIDLAKVMTEKLGPRRMALVPNAIVRYIEHIICVPTLNALLRENYPKTGGDFARGILQSLNVDVRLHDTDKLPSAGERRVLFVSNHPLGGVEGLAMIDWMDRCYGGRFYVMVNDILMAVEPLQDVFLPINKHGRQGTRTVKQVDEALAGDNPVLIFPAGLVSRMDGNDRLHDKPWRKTFVNLAIRHRRTVVPVFCGGRNSMAFYRFCRWRERLGIKLNIEMVRLPREVLNMRDRSLDITFGNPIPWAGLQGGVHAQQTADDICRIVYGLQPGD